MGIPGMLRLPGVDGKQEGTLLLLFSAAWCPDCVAAAHELRASLKGQQVVYVPSDKSDADALNAAEAEWGVVRCGARAQAGPYAIEQCMGVPLHLFT